MKKFLFILPLFFSLTSLCQNNLTWGKIVEATQQLKVVGKSVTGISEDSTGASKSAFKLITEKAIKAYVDNHAGVGGTGAMIDSITVDNSEICIWKDNVPTCTMFTEDTIHYNQDAFTVSIGARPTIHNVDPREEYIDSLIALYGGGSTPSLQSVLDVDSHANGDDIKMSSMYLWFQQSAEMKWGNEGDPNLFLGWNGATVERHQNFQDKEGDIALLTNIADTQLLNVKYTDTTQWYRGLLKIDNQSGDGGSATINYHPNFTNANSDDGAPDLSHLQVNFYVNSFLSNIQNRQGFTDKIDTIPILFEGENIDGFVFPFVQARLSSNIKFTKIFFVDNYLHTSVDLTNTINTSEGSVITNSDQTFTDNYRYELIIFPNQPLVSTPYYTANHFNLTNDLRLNSDPGTSGQILKSQGTGLPPVWGAYSSGGSSSNAGDSILKNSQRISADSLRQKNTADSMRTNLYPLIAGKQSTLTGELDYSNSQALQLHILAITQQTGIQLSDGVTMQVLDIY